MSIENSHDMPKVMGYPLVPLVFGSIFVGYLLKDMIIGAGTTFWQNSLFILPSNLSIFDAEFLPHFIKMIPVIFSSSGILLAIILYGLLPLTTVYGIKMSSLGQKFYLFFNRKWFFDKIYNEYLNQIVLKLGYDISYKTIDRGLIENLGPYGLSKLFYNPSFNLLQYQTGLLYHYTFIMLVGSIFLITVIGLFSYSLQFSLFLIFFSILFVFLVNSKKVIN